MLLSILSKFFIENPVIDKNIHINAKNLIFLISSELILFCMNITKVNSIKEYKKDNPNLYNGNFKNHKRQQVSEKKKMKKRLDLSNTTSDLTLDFIS